MGQAISPELREWVVAQLAAGHSVPSLRASMRAAGWHDDVADAALAEIEAQAAGAAPPSRPPRTRDARARPVDARRSTSTPAIAACRCCRRCAIRA